MSSGVASARPAPIQASSTKRSGYCRGPPRRRPSAPATAASGQPALGERWRAASRSTAFRAPRGRGAAYRDGREDDPEGAEPGCRQVDQIVEARREPAELSKALVFVTDHAVRRVDRLVDDGARQSEHGAPEGGRNDGIGKILGQALDSGASDAGFIQSAGIAADDVAQPSPAFGQPAPRQAVLDTRDVLVKAALRQQGRCQDGYRQTRDPPRHDR